jgi:hypothetical protein
MPSEVRLALDGTQPQRIELGLEMARGPVGVDQT